MPGAKDRQQSRRFCLMKDPAQAEKVLTAMVKAVKKPVTVKFRKGFLMTQNINAVEFAKWQKAAA